ncbi:unnamed protein product [Echinostoma caproni]|uniref:Villin-4 n=1 Tax=Echinostoma caproni TaxID=27848 RepID=A0A183A108_9TREM|nr:unnamed protein product [Echinostoma caproni]
MGSEAIKTESLQLTGYCAYSSDKEDGRGGGGILLLVSDTLDQAEGNQMSTPNIQACSCTIQYTNCIVTVVGAYRAPLSDEEEDGQLLDYLTRRPKTYYNYVQSQGHSGVAVGNVVNAHGVSAAPSKEKTEFLKSFFEKVHLTELGRPLPDLLCRLPEQRMTPFVLEA